MPNFAEQVKRLAPGTKVFIDKPFSILDKPVFGKVREFAGVLHGVFCIEINTHDARGNFLLEAFCTDASFTVVGNEAIDVE